MHKKAWFLLLLAAVPARAAFQADLSSVRASSLGGAVAASGEGAADLFASPAALAKTDASQVSLMYGKPFSGIPEADFSAGAAALAVPTRWGTWGAGAASFRAQGALEETTFLAGYGVSLLGGRVRAGASLKSLNHKYLISSDPQAQGDPIFRGGSGRTAFDADLGLTMDVMGPVRAGVAVRNVRRADVGLAGRDRLRREIKAGLAVTLPSLGVTAAGDLFTRSRADGSAGALQPAVGVEKSFQGPLPFFLRAGANRDRFSTGLGLTRGRLSLDYGFLMPRAVSGADASTHQVQMTFRFAAGKDR